MGLVSARCWELGSIGIEETPHGLCAYFEETTDQEEIRRSFSTALIQTNLPPVSFHEGPDRDPVYLGTRFVVVPVDQAERRNN